MPQHHYNHMTPGGRVNYDSLVFGNIVTQVHKGLNIITSRLYVKNKHNKSYSLRATVIILRLIFDRCALGHPNIADHII